MALLGWSKRLSNVSTDFPEQLRRQLTFIERSAAAYDEGIHEEALRIAVNLRVIFHDTKRSVSILKHLGAKGSVSVLSSLRPGHTINPKTGIHTGVFLIGLTPEGLKPPLASAERREFLSAKKWWDECVYCWEMPLTRRDMVLAAANQDGGAHVDANPDGKTRSLVKSMGSVKAHAEAAEIPLNNQHFHFLRQFAFEVLNSPDLVRAAGLPTR